MNHNNNIQRSIILFYILLYTKYYNIILLCMVNEEHLGSHELNLEIRELLPLYF
jgi:hypothetical protein